MILGIDLGTTNSLAAVIRDGKTVFVEFDDSPLLPSVVSFDPQGKLLVGQKAKNQYFLEPENSVKSIKRLMGSDVSTLLNGKGCLPEEISAMILRHIKSTAEQQFGEPIPEAIITVPAYFSDDQRQATAKAGQIAGFEVKRIINEPTAAALSYHYENEREIKAVVYDLGGGTFDVSVVNISQNVVEVLASQGDNQLGGDDFDRELAELMADRLQEKTQTDLTQNPRAWRQLMRIAEQCKITLTDHPFCQVVENIHPAGEDSPINIELEVSRQDFEARIRGYIEATMKLVHAALNDAGLQADEIDQILLVGGSSRIPLIATEFESIFRIAPVGSIDPDRSVCIGAAIQGAIVNDDAVDAILVDVTPYTFGTRAASHNMFGFLEDDDIFVPVIKRNTPLPASKSEVFYKIHPAQSTIEVKIYQGESKVASDNRLIGAFTVQDLTEMAKNTEILLTMNLDLNGLLTVVATEKATGRNKRITIENTFDHGDIHQSIQKVAELFGVEDESAGEDAENEAPAAESDAASVEKQTQKWFVARTMIEKSESKMDQADPADAEEMKKIIIRLQDAIDQKDVEAVEQLTDELTDILFYID